MVSGRLCPVCGRATISWPRAALALLGTSLKCPECQSQLTFGWFSRTGLLLVFLPSLAVSAALSIKLRSYVPYALVPVALLLAVIAGVAFGRLSVLIRNPVAQALTWLLFALFLGLLIIGVKAYAQF